jgi:hypothetical protein
LKSAGRRCTCQRGHVKRNGSYCFPFQGTRQLQSYFFLLSHLQANSKTSNARLRSDRTHSHRLEKIALVLAGVLHFSKLFCPPKTTKAPSPSSHVLQANKMKSVAAAIPTVKLNPRSMTCEDATIQAIEPGSASYLATRFRPRVSANAAGDDPSPKLDPDVDFILTSPSTVCLSVNDFSQLDDPDERSLLPKIPSMYQTSAAGKARQQPRLCPRPRYRSSGFVSPYARPSRRHEATTATMVGIDRGLQSGRLVFTPCSHALTTQSHETPLGMQETPAYEPHRSAEVSLSKLSLGSRDMCLSTAGIPLLPDSPVDSP